MVSLDMRGSYPLNSTSIEAEVRQTSPGNYALGHLNAVDQFVPEYVGRSDSDVRGRLMQHVGSGYARFKFSYATSPKAAFDKECRNYHDFERQLGNKYHPQRPGGTNWECPCCTEFDQ